MAVISLLLSFLLKKVGSIVQVIFGWSVTALFGRLESKKQIAVSIALLLSIAWPLFVIGLFFPAVAGWALAFLPLKEWVGETVLRIVWGGLALASPLLVGVLVHFAAPSKKTKMLGALLNGYPISLGLFAAFFITAITVPLVKLASILRGWNDEHVYVQARVGRYEKVVTELGEAVARAGIVPVIDDPPAAMTLATRVLRLLARGAVTPIVAEEVKRVHGPGFELYLYPSDLLMRGSAQKVALVRAMMMRTDVEAHAYLVGSAKGQCIQDELGRLIDVIRDRADGGRDVGGLAESRLVAIWKEMNAAQLPFEEWVMLESIARRVERRLGVFPLDEQGDALDQIAAKANAPEGIRIPGAAQRMQKHTKENERNNMTTEAQPVSGPMSLEDASTAELVKEAMEETKELVRLEVEMAKEEVKIEAKQAAHAAIGIGIGAGATILFLSMLAVTLILALGGTVWAALGVAGGFLVIAGVSGILAYGALPKKPFEKTRARLNGDIARLKEHLA